MPSIFISYRRSDTGGHAGRLFDRLRYWYAEEELFIDVNSIGWGDDFPEAIDQAIHGAKVVLIVIGPDWLEALNERAKQPQIDYVRHEVSVALERQAADKARLFPILVGDSEMPKRHMLDISLQDEMGKLFDCNTHELPADVRQWDFQFSRLQENISLVDGVPAPKAQVALEYGRLMLGLADIEPMKRPALLDVPAVQRAFGVVSTSLLNWPQEIGGKWIVRPELDRLHEQTKNRTSSVTVILSEPGGGKSAILARLGKKLATEGVVLLAVKADQIPKRTATLSDLDEWIGSTVPVSEALRRLAEEQRVVVLIDQLDALSDLMDQHTERLDIIVRLIHSVRDVAGLSVLVSCREFEYRNDVRFASLNAEEISLQRPAWEQVRPLLTARGFETTGWSEEVRDVLRTPQHLAMFLDNQAYLTGAPIFANYYRLLAEIVRERLELPHGTRTIEAAEAIAATMAVEEELWLGRVRFEKEFSTEMDLLEEAGFLVQSENGLSIGFRHQTVFDFLRARGFLRAGPTLEKFAIDQKKQSLFVRPTLWSTLNFLRASDKSAYSRQFEALWRREDLRPHVRCLLIDFLGHIADPDDQEAQWLLPSLDEKGLRSRVLVAMAGSAGWFRRVSGRLAGFMAAEPEKASELTPMLRAAASFDSNGVLRLVKQHWIPNVAYSRNALVVLREIKAWDESGVEVVCKLVDPGQAEPFVVQDIAKKIAVSRPDLAPKVVVRYLRAITNRIEGQYIGQNHGIDSEGSLGGKVESTPDVDRLRLYERLIDSSFAWHGIEDLAQRCLKAFVKEIWPWLVELFNRLEKPEDPDLHRYRGHQGLAFLRETSESQPLQRAIEIAIRGYAESEPEAFLEFLQVNKDSELRVLHRLLAIGLERIARQYPAVVLEYLLEDPRRFAIGDILNEHSETQALISAAVPWMSPDQASRLEYAIRKWTWYRRSSTEGDVKSRRNQQKEMRTRRLRLLRVFPVEHLSSEGKRYVGEEKRAFPNIPSEEPRIRGGWIGSPMSSGQMEKASDEQILALFDELTDDTEWDHPTRRWTDLVGGSVQASREFADFASKAPDRALRLIRRFRAGKTERPAGAALAKLAKGSADPEEVIACVHELDSRGFISEEFRTDAARSLGDVALCNGGLSDRTCEMLESWINEWEPVASAVARDIKIGSEREVGTEDNHQSLLWDTRRFHVVPHGNYPFLEALRLSYLCREPRAVDEWLGVLERHLNRSEDPTVWREVAEDLWRLFQADRNRATEFLESFFSLHPEVFRTVTGVFLVAGAISWLPRELIDRIIDDWASGNWQKGPQAAGEVFALVLCRNPEDVNALRQIERVLQGNDGDSEIVDEMRVGLTHTFVAAWTEPALRAMTTGYLVRLAKAQTLAIEEALSAIFGKADPLPADDHTRDLLEALLERPSVLARGGHFLIEGMKGLLREGWSPDLIFQIANTLISEKAMDLGDVGSAWAGDAGDLADIALTLHRIQGTRELGLELCERLMEARSYGLDERIAKIDRLAFR